jgi:hypothetical protein
MNSRSPPSGRSGNQESNAISLYNREPPAPASAVPTFEFFRFRFQFQALDPVHFPPGGSSNMLRGACGVFLRKIASPDLYARLFEPGRHLGPAPSGLADWPRPFVFRAAHLDGLAAEANSFFSFDLHLFDLNEAVLSCFRAAFVEWAATGIGPGRRRARLDRIDPLDLQGQLNSAGPCLLPLDPEAQPVDSVTVRFVTPTELKSGGRVVERPEFGILFARVRDRISTLRALFGRGPLELDFPGVAERATSVTLQRCHLTWQNAARTSSRTRQTHPMGGFTGEAEYHGALQEFVPWLRAARWTGVGRQTVWGKGEIHIIRE